MKPYQFLAFLLFPLYFFAQEPDQSEEDYKVEIPTFSSTRVINGHSVETLTKGTYEFRIEHRFGDIAKAVLDAELIGTFG